MKFLKSSFISLSVAVFTLGIFATSVEAKDVKNQVIEEFLEDAFDNNPKILSLDAKVDEKIPLKNVKNWNAYVVKIKAKIKPNKKEITQKIIWFSNGEVMAPDLIDISSGLSYKELLTPSFKPEYYTKENLIYGNADAKHKVAIFSDPVCPFCKRLVPKAIKYMRKYPEKFAVYYYNLPLRIHPSASNLVKAEIAATLKGYKDVTLKLYELNVSYKEKNVDKILKAFNEKVGSNLTKKDLNAKEVLEIYNRDKKISDNLMVGGTPTLYFDGKVDKTKQKYTKVK